MLVIQAYLQYSQPKVGVLSVQEKSAQNNTEIGSQVVKVIDGDTIDVLSGGKKEKVRILGINTPETVDPRRQVECFGVEASNKAKEILAYQTIRLELDPSQSDRDKYGRLLRYIILPDDKDFGYEMIKQGYAYEYTYDSPYKYQEKYKAAQKEAQLLKVGLWGHANCQK